MWCDLDDMDDLFCPHGRGPEERAAKEAHRALVASAMLRVSPRGMAHFDGCHHKGDDPDMSRWADLDIPDAWERLGNGERLPATGGGNPLLVATDRCQACVAHDGPWIGSGRSVQTPALPVRADEGAVFGSAGDANPSSAAEPGRAVEEWIQPPPRGAVDGTARFRGLDATVADFWRFALSDLRMNNARGYLAEFLVAQAVGLGDAARIEWDAYDLLVDERIRVEVKSSAYLQAWEQRALSRIEFSGLRGTRYHPRHGHDPAGRQLNAHVYVFAVQTATRHDQYDPLDISQWDFFVLGRSALDDAAVGKSIGLPTLRRLAGEPVPWAELRQAILRHSIGQTVPDDHWWE